MKYTQSPVLVEAKQWIPEFNDKEIRDFAKAEFIGLGCDKEGCDNGIGFARPSGIKGKHAKDISMRPGDWVVKYEEYFDVFSDAEFRLKFRPSQPIGDKHGN